MNSLFRPSSFEAVVRRAARPAFGSLLFRTDTIFAEMERDMQAMQRHMDESLQADEFLRGTHFDRQRPVEGESAPAAAAVADMDDAMGSEETNVQETASEAKDADTAREAATGAAPATHAHHRTSYAYSYTSMTRRGQDGEVRSVLRHQYKDSDGRHKTLEEQRLCPAPASETDPDGMGQAFRRTLKDGDTVETTLGGVDKAEDFDVMWGASRDRSRGSAIEDSEHDDQGAEPHQDKA